MVKTFTDLDGDVHEIPLQDLKVYCTQDIVSGEITSYIIQMEMNKIKVDKENFNAIDKYWSELEKARMEEAEAEAMQRAYEYSRL